MSMSNSDSKNIMEDGLRCQAHYCKFNLSWRCENSDIIEAFRVKMIRDNF